MADLARGTTQTARSIGETDAGQADLEPVEAEVLSLAAEGLPDEEIAYRLTLTTPAVKAHLYAAFAKCAARGSTNS